MSSSEDDEDVPVVDVFAPPRRASRRSPIRDARHRALDGQRMSTMRTIVREQRELLEAEQARADDAEDELQRVLTQADALSRRLDELSGMFASERGREGGLSRASPSEAAATVTRLQIENERLKRTMREMEQKHAKETAELRAARAEGVSTSDPRAALMSADERRRLLAEVAEARKEIAIAKEARARALAETVELRERLEKSSHVVERGSPILANQPPKTPDWANVDWFAAHAETKAVETKTEVKTEPPKKSLEEIDWEAAYADIDATRARMREERAGKT